MTAFLIRTSLVGFALWVVTLIVPGVKIVGGEGDTLKRIGIIFVVAVLFGLVNAVIKPIVQVLAISFTEPELGFENYERLFTSASVQRVILTTLRICAITTVLALILGYALSYTIALASPRRQGWWLVRWGWDDLRDVQAFGRLIREAFANAPRVV